jgi:hypothetical protein
MRDRIFTTTSYDPNPMKSEHLYIIDGDKAIFPTSIRYTLCTPIFGTLTHKDLQGSNYNVLIEKFMTSEDMLFDWINHHKCSSGGFKIIELKSIQILKYEDGTTFDVDISNETIFNEDETVALITNHPAFETLKERAAEIAKENERLSIEDFANRRKTVRENNYRTWKMLNDKYLAGEFKEFEEAKV